ncbi:MAG: hypothetical protein ACXWHI_12390, partial [Candidatus Aminicenantales bacterium]
DLWGSLGYGDQESPLSADIPDHMIPVERVETPTSLRRRRKRADLYAHVTYGELERLAPVNTGPNVLVWLHLHSLQRTKGPEAWVWANLGVLKSWGIEERSYRRAIARLRGAGLIEVDAQPGRKARVRLREP